MLIAAGASDAGVGALCARAAVLGADLNVRINAPDLADEELRQALLDRSTELRTSAMEREASILQLVAASISG